VKIKSFSDVLIIDNRIYERTDKYLIRQSNNSDYYSSGVRIPSGNSVLVPRSKCPYYKVEATIIYNPQNGKSIRLEKHFSPEHFCTPLIFIPKYHDFGGTVAKGYLFRKCYYLLERDLDFIVYKNDHYIPLTPKTITHFASLKKKTYSYLLNKIHEHKNVTIFNLHKGIDLSNQDLERIP